MFDLRFTQKLGPVKTPKRVKPALIHLSEMIRKHKKCGYLPLLDMICPSKVVCEAGLTVALYMLTAVAAQFKQAGTSEAMDSTVILVRV